MQQDLKDDVGLIEEEGISFVDLLLILFKKRVFITIFSITGIVLGMTTSVLMQVTSSQVSTMVAYQWDGVELGTYPDGAPFELQQAFTLSMVINALEKSDIDLAPLEVKDALQISPIVPNDIINRLTIAQDKGETFRYIPTSFTYTLDTFTLGISTNQARLFLNTLIENFQQYLVKTYIEQTVVTNFAFASSDSFQTYDYLDRVKILNNQSTLINNVLNTILSTNTGNNFRSSTLQLSFRDILAELSLLSSLDIDTIRISIIQHVLSLDPNALVDRLNNENVLSRVTLNQKQAYLEELLLLIDAYQGSTQTIIIPGFEGVVNSTNIIDVIYQRVVTTLEDISIIAEAIQYNDDLIERYLASMDSEVDQSVLEAKMDESLALSHQTMMTMVTDTNLLLESYYRSITPRLISVLVPATLVETSNMILYTVIAFLLTSIFAVGIVLAQHGMKSYKEKRK